MNETGIASGAPSFASPLPADSRVSENLIYMRTHGTAYPESDMFGNTFDDMDANRTRNDGLARVGRKFCSRFVLRLTSNGETFAITTLIEVSCIYIYIYKFSIETVIKLKVITHETNSKRETIRPERLDKKFRHLLFHLLPLEARSDCFNFQMCTRRAAASAHRSLIRIGTRDDRGERSGTLLSFA